MFTACVETHYDTPDVSLWAFGKMHTRCLVVHYSKFRGLSVGSQPFPFDLQPTGSLSWLSLSKPLLVGDTLEQTLADWYAILLQALLEDTPNPLPHAILPPSRYSEEPEAHAPHESHAASHERA